jgi:hypothetical protein
MLRLLSFLESKIILKLENEMNIEAWSLGKVREIHVQRS